LAFVRIIFAKLCTATFFSLDCGAGDRLRYSKEVLQIDCGMPPGIVFAIACNCSAIGSLFQLLQLAKRVLHFGFCSNDSRTVLHQFLQVLLDLVWVLAVPSVEWRERISSGRIDLIVVDFT